MTATVAIWFVAKLIGCPDCAFDCERCILRRSCFAKTNTGGFPRHNRSRWRKEIRPRGVADPSQNNNNQPRSKHCAKVLAQRNLMVNRTDRLPPGACRIPESVRMKRKKLRLVFEGVRELAAPALMLAFGLENRRPAVRPLRPCEFRRSTNRKCINSAAEGISGRSIY